MISVVILHLVSTVYHVFGALTDAIDCLGELRPRFRFWIRYGGSAASFSDGQLARPE